MKALAIAAVAVVSVSALQDRDPRYDEKYNYVEPTRYLYWHQPGRKLVYRQPNSHLQYPELYQYDHRGKRIYPMNYGEWSEYDRSKYNKKRIDPMFEGAKVANMPPRRGHLTDVRGSIWQRHDPRERHIYNPDADVSVYDKKPIRPVFENDPAPEVVEEEKTEAEITPADLLAAEQAEAEPEVGPVLDKKDKVFKPMKVYHVSPALTSNRAGRCDLIQNNLNKEDGLLKLKQRPGHSIAVDAVFVDLTPGTEYELIVKELGDIRNEIGGCDRLGAEYNPVGETIEENPHADVSRGRVQSFTADEDGMAQVDNSELLQNLVGKYSIYGRGMVLREKDDTAALACCVIGIDTPEYLKEEEVVEEPEPLVAKEPEQREIDERLAAEAAAREEAKRKEDERLGFAYNPYTQKRSRDPRVKRAFDPDTPYDPKYTPYYPYPDPSKRYFTNPDKVERPEPQPKPHYHRRRPSYSPPRQPHPHPHMHQQMPHGYPQMPSYPHY